MTVKKRSLSIRRHMTSVSLEDAFFVELRRIAGERELSLAGLIAEIDAGRAKTTNLSSALRLYVLEDLKARASAARA